MHTSTTSSASSPSAFARVLIAFVLGLPVAFITTFSEQSVAAPGIYGIWQMPVVILGIAAILSILLDPNLRRGEVRIERVLLGILVLLVLAGLLIAGETILLNILQNPNANQNLVLINLVLIPLLVGLAIAFTIGSSTTSKLALATGVVGWFGAGLHFVVIALIDYIVYEQRTPGGDGGIALPLTIGWVLIAFLFAALGALLGRLLRKGLLGE